MSRRKELNGKVVNIITIEDLIEATPHRFKNTVTMLLYEIQDKIQETKYDAVKNTYTVKKKCA